MTKKPTETCPATLPTVDSVTWALRVITGRDWRNGLGASALAAHVLAGRGIDWELTDVPEDHPGDKEKNIKPRTARADYLRP